ncbi:hypothetical protein TcYC6_0082460 [Trypanosoma cruzi]|nr:hypothetical protein TcYC6_0082460 [Trypanosoma cruzi]
MDNTLLVVEEKTTASRLRWIARPRDKNRDDPCEANAPLSHIFHCLPPVVAEAASRLGPKASFIASLPQGTRHLFRCRVEDGALAGPARLPMGHNAGPEILRIIISSAFAGRRRWFTPSGPHLHWSVLAFGSIMHALQDRKAVRHCGRPRCFVMRPAVTPRWGGPRIGRCAVRPSGVRFDHTHRPVFLSDKFVRLVCAMPSLNSSTVAGMEVTASRLFVRGGHFGHAFI